MVLPFVNVIIENEQGKILIGKHPETTSKVYPGFYDVPGGKLENEESAESCAKREVMEETGLKITHIKLLGIFHHSGKNIPDYCKSRLPSLGIFYRARASGKLEPSELSDMQWITRQSALKLKLTPWARHFLKSLH
jgi:8-oxo-dGTP diphosphatase